MKDEEKKEEEKGSLVQQYSRLKRLIAGHRLKRRRH